MFSVYSGGPLSSQGDPMRGAGASGGGGVQFQNALIGQQDLSGKSRFHTSNNTQRMFGIVAKLCEIGNKMQHNFKIKPNTKHTFNNLDILYKLKLKIKRNSYLISLNEVH